MINGQPASIEELCMHDDDDDEDDDDESCRWHSLCWQWITWLNAYKTTQRNFTNKLAPYGTDGRLLLTANFKVTW